MEEQKIIQPTIGRKVWYWPTESDRGVNQYRGSFNRPPMEAFDDSQPCDATVVYVHSDRLVNLRVTDHNGNTHVRTSVTLVQPGDPEMSNGSSYGYATWMPYQVAQAKA